MNLGSQKVESLLKIISLLVRGARVRVAVPVPLGSSVLAPHRWVVSELKTRLLLLFAFHPGPPKALQVQHSRHVPKRVYPPLWVARVPRLRSTRSGGREDSSDDFRLPLHIYLPSYQLKFTVCQPTHSRWQVLPCGWCLKPALEIDVTAPDCSRVGSSQPGPGNPE